MSFEMIGRVLKHSEATGTNKMVLIGIAWHMGENPDAGCYPSQSTLAHYANTTVRQVRRSIKALIDSGELHSYSNGAWMRGSGNRTNLYTIKIDCPDWCDGSKFHNVIQANSSPEMRTFLVTHQDIHGN